MSKKSSGLGNTGNVFSKVVKPTEGEKKLRKRRSDYKGGDLKDYHKTKVLAARVNGEIATKVKAAAKAEGISVNAWMVRFIEKYIDVELDK